MNREIFSLLSELSKEPSERNNEKLGRVAELITAEGNNEVKQLYAQWLEENPDKQFLDLEPAQDVETLKLDDHDRGMLNSLLGRS